MLLNRYFNEGGENLPNQIGAGEGFCRLQRFKRSVGGAAAVYIDDADLSIPVGYVALIHAVQFTRDGGFNTVATDYAVTCFLFASQTKEGALSANLDEATRGDLIAQYNDEYGFVAAGDGVVHAGTYNYQIVFPKPLLLQKGELRLYTVTGGTVPSNNYITVHVTYELARVSPSTLATLLSGAID